MLNGKALLFLALMLILGLCSCSFGTTISIGSPSASFTTSGPITYTITYGDADFNCATLAAGNVTLNKTGTANGTVAVTGTGITRTVWISGITGDGTLGISIAAGTASDLAGNTAPAAGPSATFTVDNTPPTISIGPPSASFTTSGPITYTITYGDADFNCATLAAGNVTLNKTGTANGTVAVTSTGITRTVWISGITGDGTLGISIAAGTASDLAGNTAPAAGPSATFTVDNTPPSVNSVTVSPSIAAAGDSLHVVVNAADFSGVSSITAGGVTLTNTGATTWEGDLTAASSLGVHAIAISAADVLGNITNTSGSYKTASILGISGRCLPDPIMAPASSRWLFRMWGKVTIIDANSFYLNDGSGTSIRVVAPGYSGIGNGDYVSVRGVLDVSSSPPTLTARAEHVVCYH